jgi:hypothetical protein
MTTATIDPSAASEAALTVRVLHLRVAELEAQLAHTEQTLREVLHERYPDRGGLR